MALFNYATFYVGLQNANNGDENQEEDPALVYLRKFAIDTVKECFFELVRQISLSVTEFVQGLLFKRDYETLIMFIISIGHLSYLVIIIMLEIFSDFTINENFPSFSI